MKLNLACGHDKKEGWFNVDISPDVNPDAKVNLLHTPWKFLQIMDKEKDKCRVVKLNDESVEEIFCSHFIEHIGDELIPFMDEAHRVLKPGGMFHIVCPYYTSVRSVQDPTHKRFISEHMFQYFSAAGRKLLNVEQYPIKSNFDVEEIRFHFPKDMENVADDERKYLLQHCWNTAADFEVLLKKHDPNEQAVDRQANSVLLH